MERRIKIIQDELNESVKKNEELSYKNLKKADTINYKSTTNEILITDRFGFLSE